MTIKCLLILIRVFDAIQHLDFDMFGLNCPSQKCFLKCKFPPVCE